MVGHTKERHTKSIQLHLTDPANRKDKAMETLVSLGFKEVSDSILWREAFPEYGLPGFSITGYGNAFEEGTG
jgi:hypothetical protein